MLKRTILSGFLAGFFIFQMAPSALAYHKPTLLVQVNWVGSKPTNFSFATANAMSGVSLAVADLGEDGVDEIIAGNGLGNEPRVRVLRVDGSEISSFLAYAPDMGLGINVAACDLDGDGAKEIVTAPERGGGPHIRVFNAAGDAIDAGGFFAHEANVQSGIHLACGDLDADGNDEIVTLPAAGAGPHVRVWKWKHGAAELAQEFFAFDATDARGLVGVVHGGMLTLASAKGGDVNIKKFAVTSNTLSLVGEQSIVIDASGVTGIFADGDTLKLTTASNASIVDISTGVSTPITSETGSLVAAVGTFSSGTRATITAASRPWFIEATAGKSIHVDLSEQRLYAYDGGILANTFLVSTGKWPYATPLGNHSVLAKLPYVYYAGTDLDGTEWDLGNVPWNLRFFPKHYIHYAYWHNNFGHPMSHGCVNVSLTNMKWIYNWSDVGIAVEVRK